MAFFKFRLPNPGAGDEGSSAGSSGESLEVLRRRARQRLIGATVLVLLAVIGFPMLFDTQPRPVAVDIPIDIPDKQKTPPPSVPAALSSPSASVAAAPAAESGAVSAQASLGQREEVVAPQANASSAPVTASVAKPESVTSTKAAPDSKPAPEPAATRYVVQVGAYADEAKARDVRNRLEKAGLKTYTHVAETKEGKRTRVRLGPFASKEDAEKTVARIKSMNLQATLLTL